METSILEESKEEAKMEKKSILEMLQSQPENTIEIELQEDMKALLTKLVTESDPEEKYRRLRKLDEGKHLKQKNRDQKTELFGLFHCVRENSSKLLLMKVSEGSSQNKLNQLIQREVHTLLFELQGIKGVVHLKEAFIFNYNVYQIFQGSHCILSNLIRRYKEEMQEGFSQFQAAYIVYLILQILLSIHAKGILLRNLTARSILVSKNFNLTICNFESSVSQQNKDGRGMSEILSKSTSLSNDKGGVDGRSIVYILVDLLSYEEKMWDDYSEVEQRAAYIQRVLGQGRRSQECSSFITQALELRTPQQLLKHRFILKKEFEGKHQFLVSQFRESITDLMNNTIK